MSIFDLYGLGGEDMGHFCAFAARFHQDFDVEGIDFRQGIETVSELQDPAWRAAFKVQLAKVLAAVPDPDEFITVFGNAGADNWTGDARTELESWLREEPS